MQKEPGIVVVNHSLKNKQISVLRDPLAASPQMLLEKANADATIDLRITPFISSDNAIILKRAKKRLNPPKTVKFAIKDSTLFVAGKAPIQWLDSLDTNWQGLVGINQINTEKLQSYNPNLAQLNAAKAELEAIVIPFANNTISLSKQAGQLLLKAKQRLDKLQALVKQSKQRLVVSIVGYSDNTGTEMINNKLSAQRADVVRQNLIALGVPTTLFDRDSRIERGQLDERSVRFYVRID